MNLVRRSAAAACGPRLGGWPWSRCTGGHRNHLIFGDNNVRYVSILPLDLILLRQIVKRWRAHAYDRSREVALIFGSVDSEPAQYAMTSSPTVNVN
jgi:hypothetical protein